MTPASELLRSGDFPDQLLIKRNLRLAKWGDFHPTSNYPAGKTFLQILGSTCGWLWAAGALVVFVVGVAGMIKATVILRRVNG